MPDTFRVASFNVENLFARPKVFNFRDKSVGDTILARIGEFRKILKKDTFTTADKRNLVKAFTEDADSSDPEKKPLKDFIIIREDRGSKLWKRNSSRQIVGVKASGQRDLDLTIEFKKAKYSEMARKNTGKVIRSVKADIACIVEADSRETLKRFDTDNLGSRYRYEMLLDGNDRRGIDVGLYSRFPLGGIWTHMFDGGSSRTFSRDCPEYEIILPNGQPLYILCNHLKSKGYDFNGNASRRRKRQATAIADILSEYDLRNELVVVAGDLNDTPDSDPLKPLTELSNLFDVLELQYGSDMGKRWTYHYRSFEQIDYLLVSKPLKDAFVEAGVQRKGIAKLKALTEADSSIPNEKEYDSVTSWTNQASDHGAVWADFEL